jgi:hypothetical protein
MDSYILWNILHVLALGLHECKMGLKRISVEVPEEYGEKTLCASPNETWYKKQDFLTPRGHW